MEFQCIKQKNLKLLSYDQIGLQIMSLGQMKATAKAIMETVSILPITSSILSAKYPQFPNVISAVYLLALKVLKPRLFEIKQIPDDCFEDLLLHNCFKTDFIGDWKSCALLSINSLAALSATNQTWLQLSRYNQFLASETLSIDSEVDATTVTNDVRKTDWKIVMPNVPNTGGTNNNCDKNDSSDEQLLIQCLVVSTVAKDFVLYLSDSTFNNVTRALGLPAPVESFPCFVEVEKFEVNTCPKIAKKAVIAQILSSFEMKTENLEELLAAYFARPKLVRENDTFSVKLEKYVPHLKCSADYYNLDEVFFKVVNLMGETKSNSQPQSKICSLGYYITRDSTRLYLDPAVQSFTISRSTKHIKFHSQLGCEIPICPNGLAKYNSELKNLFRPFIGHSKPRAKPMFLLAGNEGSGKETVLYSVAQYFGLHVLKISSFEFFGIAASAVEAKLEFVTAKARKIGPCIIYLKNVESIGKDRENCEDVRLVSTFQKHIFEVLSRKSEYPIIVVGSTTIKPSELTPTVARSFVETITFEVPKSEDSFGILNWFVTESAMTCNADVLRKVSEKTKGYAFADLRLLVQHAIRFHDEVNDEDDKLLLKHFDKGIEIMDAVYSDSIGAAKVPTVHWDDVGGLADLKEEIMLTLNFPLKHPEMFDTGLKRSGILFYGPPGTGKTLMAKAIATECNFNFLSVKGPELMNMYVGQSEKNVREVFERARDASPCIIFFDELDSLAPNRGKSGDSGGVADRVVSQLLAEMDGLQKNNNVFVVAATNRPDLVDPALLRPGRFDKMFYVGVCEDEASKLSVMKALTRKFLLSVDVDFAQLVTQLPAQITGADLYALCSNAWTASARKAIQKIEAGSEVSLPLEVGLEHFAQALSEFVPSLSADDLDYYQQLRNKER